MTAVVKVTQGSLQGEIKEDHTVFRGIPFAAPPTGSRRFQPPADPEPWTGVRSALKNGPTCPQIKTAMPGMAGSGPNKEDCLYLNVFTPAVDQKRRPVMFWIHGGGFVLGSGSETMYDGSRLAVRGDVVVVTINYRLGALGYADFGADGEAFGAGPNNGQLDQVKALEWTRDHIAAFGGDPDNVTIFGESAGAMAVDCLLAMPVAKGLFHKAIMQSGAGFRTKDPEQLQGLSLRLKAACEEEGKTLQEIPVEDIVTAQTKVLKPEETMTGFGPVTDGTILPGQPLASLGAGNAAGIPVMLGTNRDEMKLFNNMPGRKPVTDEQLLGLVRQTLNCDEPAATETIAAYKAAREEKGLPVNLNDLYDGFMSLTVFRLPSARAAAARDGQAGGTWHYMFTYESPAFGGHFAACHALEIPFVFGNLNDTFANLFAGKGPDVEKLSGQMMDAWLAFARTGDPSHAGIGTWQQYSSADRATMVFDKTCRMENDPYGAERLLVESRL